MGGAIDEGILRPVGPGLNGGGETKGPPNRLEWGGRISSRICPGTIRGGSVVVPGIPLPGLLRSHGYPGSDTGTE